MTEGALGPHVSLETLTAFGAHELPREETFVVAWHLFLCPECRSLLSDAGPGARDLFRLMFGDRAMDYPLSAYSGPVGRFAAGLLHLGLDLEAERTASRELVARLLRHPPERRRLLVRERERYRTLPVAESLLVACRAGWSDDPATSEELAELALWILDRLDRDRHPAALLNDLRSQAWASIANCRRIRSDLRSVSEAFQLAETFLRRGSGDVLDQAYLLDLRVSYLIDQRRFAEADQALERLLAIHRDARDRHAERRALMKLAKLRREEGRVEEAVPLLEEAGRAVDLVREPHLELLLKRNLATFLSEVGRAEEARALLPQIRALARDQASRTERLRVLWTEGLIYHRLGHLELAVEALEQARAGFVDLGLGYDAAFVTLDLALVHLDSGEMERASALARTMLPLFASRDLHREALAALSLVRRAMEEETLTRQLVVEVAAYLRWARRNPALHFEPGYGPEQPHGA